MWIEWESARRARLYQPSVPFEYRCDDPKNHRLDKCKNVNYEGKKRATPYCMYRRNNQSNNETKFKLNIPKMMEFQMTFIISMDSNDIFDVSDAQWIKRWKFYDNAILQFIAYECRILKFSFAAQWFYGTSMWVSECVCVSIITLTWVWPAPFLHEAALHRWINEKKLGYDV